MKTYAVHSIFHTLQGEGFHIGKPAVFVRFSGCNLWSGQERHRGRAVCQFCDTEFLGGKRMTSQEIVKEVSEKPGMVVFTGGEPALQLDEELVRELQRRNRYVAIETNGTRRIPSMIDWICVSPKAGTDIVVNRADELKLVYPQNGMEPWLAAAKVNAKHLWLSPMDGSEWRNNVLKSVEYVKMDSRWRLNIQAHKIWDIE